MQITVETKKTKQTYTFKDYAEFNSWLLSTGENLWIKVRFDFITKIVKEKGKGSTVFMSYH